MVQKQYFKILEKSSKHPKELSEAMISEQAFEQTVSARGKRLEFSTGWSHFGYKAPKKPWVVAAANDQFLAGKRSYPSLRVGRGHRELAGIE